MIIEMAPPPRRDDPVDLDAAWRDIQVALAEMKQAAETAQLAASAPMNLLLRVFRTQAEATSTLIFAIARCERDAVDKLRQIASQTEAALKESRHAASFTAAARVLHVALNLVFVLALGAAIWSLSRPAELPFEVEFNAADHGQITCGAASRDASGDYHCAMRIVLKRHRQTGQ